MAASTEAAVDCTVGIQHKHSKGLIRIKLKQGQIEPICRDDAHAHELFEQRPQDGVLINEVVIQFHALFTGNAAKHNQNWLAG